MTRVFLVVGLVAQGDVARAEDPPVPVPRWGAHIFGDLAVSRDGAWIGGHTVSGWNLFPAKGGRSIALDLPGDEKAGFTCAFTADSKWFVATGDTNVVEIRGTPVDRTQNVYFFPVAAPAKRKSIQMKLQAEVLEKAVKGYVDPTYRNMKRLTGGVVCMVPFIGSRVLLDRGSAGVEMWDAATATKVPMPVRVEGYATCGISSDGAQFVRTIETGLEIRDVKSNHAIQTIGVATGPKERAFITRVALAPGGGEVVAAFRRFDPDSEHGTINGYTLACWSVADGKKLWESSLDSTDYIAEFVVTEHWALALLKQTLVLIDLRDGSNPEAALQGRTCNSVQPSADGRSLWVADDTGTTRLDLPEPIAK